MQRRKFLNALAGATAVAAAGCTGKQPQAADSQPKQNQQTYKWKMVTTWPPNYPGLGTGGANFVAKAIEEMSGGRVQIKVYGGGELVPAFEVFDAVSDGTAELGHGAAYYWRDKSDAAALFTSIPFGMNAQEMMGWYYHADGLELWREVYAPFNLVPFPAGNTGVQMGGWFNREINSLEDLKGLNIRMPGLGGEVLRRAGAVPVAMPGSEIFTSLQTGTLDAAEWVGPYNDLAFGMHNAAKYYYSPGWHEPGPVLECIVNQQAWDSLPPDLQAIVGYACEAANTHMLALYTAQNNRALETLVNEHDVQLRTFPPDVIELLRRLSDEVHQELAAKDPVFAKVYNSYRTFQAGASKWLEISEQAYMKARGAG